MGRVCSLNGGDRKCVHSFGDGITYTAVTRREGSEVDSKTVEKSSVVLVD
jgi:hypothetical protein